MDDLADVALSAHHRLASRDSVDLDELVDDRWITWLSGTICHDWLLYTLRSRGHEPKVAHTAGEHATQLALVAAGLGAAIIPRLGREPSPRGVRFVPVRPALRRHVYALWRSETSRRRAIRAAVEAFQRSAASLAPGTTSRSARGPATRARRSRTS